VAAKAKNLERKKPNFFLYLIQEKGEKDFPIVVSQ
jgi:hypothetical protein